MPVQTTKTANIYFPDGALVAVKGPSDVSYFDVGAINSAVSATLNWDENQVETANAGKTIKQIRNMTIAGGFTLIDLDPEGVDKLGGDVFERVVTAGTIISALDDQVISAGWSNMARIPLEIVETSSGNEQRASAAPIIASVTGASAGVLASGADYFVIADSLSPSGYSIQLNTSGAAGAVTSEIVTIVYTSVLPIASTTLYAGSSTALLAAYAMQITHTDDNGKIRRLELFSVDPNSGGFQFNFKGANEDGLEEMPLAFTAKLDTSLTNNRQLMAWTVQDGAA